MEPNIGTAMTENRAAIKEGPNAEELAAEYGTGVDVMAKFLGRFAPQNVAAGTFAQPADTMLFVHIPKTAGVSLGESFQSVFDRFYGVQWDNIGPSFRQSTRLAAYEQCRGKGRQVIMGHFGWPELQLWRNHEMPMKCGTVFREPVARIISNFNYNSSDAHPGQKKFTERFPSLEDYVNNLELDVQITQALGFISSFEDALGSGCIDFCCAA